MVAPRSKPRYATLEKELGPDPSDRLKIRLILVDCNKASIPCLRRRQEYGRGSSPCMVSHPSPRYIPLSQNAPPLGLAQVYSDFPVSGLAQQDRLVMPPEVGANTLGVHPTY